MNKLMPAIGTAIALHSELAHEFNVWKYQQVQDSMFCTSDNTVENNLRSSASSADFTL